MNPYDLNDTKKRVLRDVPCKSYSLTYYCDNCGHHYPIKIEFGRKAPSNYECPRCGVNGGRRALWR